MPSETLIDPASSRQSDLPDAEAFALETYFAGTTLVRGVVVDRFGGLRQRFHARIEGHFDGSLLKLDEIFHYSDAEDYYRQWVIEPLGNCRYRGQASDMVGDTRGIVSDGEFRWRYKLDIPMFGGIWRCGFDDVMYPQGDGLVLNKANMTRLGIHIATCLASFQKI